MILMKSGTKLNASIAASVTGDVDISTEGSLDWSHWGLADNDDWNHKTGITAIISNITPTGSIVQFAGNSTWPKLVWNNGTPTESGDTYAMFYLTGTNNGYDLTIGIATSLRTAKLYCGAYDGVSRITLSFSDNSVAPVIFDIDTAGANSLKRTVTIQFKCVRPGVTLNISHKVTSGGAGRNVGVQGVTLA